MFLAASLHVPKRSYGLAIPIVLRTILSHYRDPPAVSLRSSLVDTSCPSCLLTIASSLIRRIIEYAIRSVDYGAR